MNNPLCPPITHFAFLKTGQFLLGLVVCFWLSPCYTAFAQNDPPPIQAGDIEVELTKVIEPSNNAVLQYATMLTTTGDGSGKLFLPEQVRGRIRIEDNGTFMTFLDIDDVDPFFRNPGLLCMAFHPDYLVQGEPGFGKLYTFHAAQPDPSTPPDFSTNGNVRLDNVITEWTVDSSDPNIVDVNSRREILRTSQSAVNHSGGMLVFDQLDYLNISFGTPGPDLMNASSLQDIVGSVVRIDPLDPASNPNSPDPVSANGKYRIPLSNPWVSDPTAIHELFAVGLRNSFRMAIDSISGYYFVGDVGEGAREEVSAFKIGEYLGWPYWEGTKEGLADPPKKAPPFTFPLAEYGHDDGRAVIGGYVYRGSIPQLQNKYIFAEFSWGTGQFNSHKGRLLWIDPFESDGVTLKDPANIDVNEFQFSADTIDVFEDNKFDITVYGFGVDDDGELYVLGQAGTRQRIYKFVSAAEIVIPDTVDAILGSNTEGTILDVYESDDEYLKYLRGNPVSPFAPSIILEIQGQLADANPNSLAIKIETSADSNAIEQVIRMFNFDSGQYESVDTRMVGMNNDGIAEVALTGDVSRFVDSSTGTVKTKVSYGENGAPILLGWTVSIDQFVWLID